MPKKKLHLYEREAIVRSVLLGHRITAQCGDTCVIARSDVDAAVDSEYKSCVACLLEIGENRRQEDVTILAAKGWLNLLEQEWIASYTARFTPHVYTASTTARWEWKA